MSTAGATPIPTEAQRCIIERLMSAELPKRRAELVDGIFGGDSAAYRMAIIPMRKHGWVEYGECCDPQISLTDAGRRAVGVLA